MNEKKFLYLMLSGVLIVWAGFSFFVTLFVPTWEVRGQFGDLFGSVNSLFSGLAFVGLMYTIVLQQKQITMQRVDLALQRKELRLQREEMKASRGELANQTRAQEAMFRATVAQLKISAGQIEMEALKIQHGRTGDSQDKARVNAKIQQLGRDVQKIADDLAASVLDSQPA